MKHLFPVFCQRKSGCISSWSTKTLPIVFSSTNFLGFFFFGPLGAIFWMTLNRFTHKTFNCFYFSVLPPSPLSFPHSSGLFFTSYCIIWKAFGDEFNFLVTSNIELA